MKPYKIGIIGRSLSGKTTLIKYYKYKKFIKNTGITIGFEMSEIYYKNKSFYLFDFNCSGKFLDINLFYIKKMDFLIILFKNGKLDKNLINIAKKNNIKFIIVRNIFGNYKVQKNDNYFDINLKKEENIYKLLDKIMY